MPMAVIKKPCGRNLYHSSVQNYVETFYAKKKVKDPMLDGLLNNFTKKFSIQRRVSKKYW